MAISFNEELIRVEYVIGEETITETVSGQITVPDNKPDILRVVDVTANIINITTEIEEEGVDITADIEAGVIYVADVDEPYFRQPVHFTEGTFQFTNFVDIPDAEIGMNVFTDLKVRKVTYEMIDERTVEVTVVISKFVKVTEYRQITVITDLTGIPEDNITSELLRIEDVVGEDMATTVISGRIELPEGKPPIERILNAQAELLNLVTEITEDGVIVTGSVEGGVIYVADVPEPAYQQPVHFLEGTFNFSEAFDIPGAEEGMSVYANTIIRKVTYDYIDEDTVEVNVTIQFFVKVTEPKQVEVIIDIMSDQVEVERELLRVEDVVGEDTIFETVSGRLNVPAAKPDIERVIEATSKIISTETTTEIDGVMIEGEIEGRILYVADVEDPYLRQPVHFTETEFNFDNFVDIPGTEAGMNAHTEVKVQKTNYDLLNARTVEITSVIRKFAKVTEFRQLEIIVDLVVVSEVTEPGVCPPSYVVYVVQPGDTLWKISRRYRTTVDAIIEANPNINPDNLQVGQKICVPGDIIRPKG